MNEATLKAGLVRALRTRLPAAMVLRHEDRFRAGVPDLSVTIGMRTAWVEVKYDRPGARGRLTAIQERTLRRLGGLLVLYVEATGVMAKRGVQVGDDGGWLLANRRQGFNHAAVAEVVAQRLE